MFDRFRKKKTITVSDKKQSPLDSLFDEIVGHENLKKLILRYVEDDTPINILFVGSRGSGKSLFLESVNNLPYSYYADNNTTGPGIINYLYQNPNTRYLCLDEFEKLDLDSQSVLLNVMETGNLISTKVRKQFNINMKISVFATANNKARISREMKSRFLILHFKDYSYTAFLETSAVLLYKRYGIPKEFAWTVADTVWKDLKSNDIRDVLKIGKIIKKPDDLEWIVETLKEYDSETTK